MHQSVTIFFCPQSMFLSQLSSMAITSKVLALNAVAVKTNRLVLFYVIGIFLQGGVRRIL